MSNDNSSIPVCKVPNCRFKVDIVIKSGDGTRLGAHKDSLYQLNQSFPRPSVSSTGKETITYVELNEPDKILQLLLGLSHRGSRDISRKISTCDLDTVLALADAAGSYDNQSAMESCKAAMGDFACSSPENALRVIPYLLDPYKSMPEADALALHTMDLPMETVEKHLKIPHAPVYLVYIVYRFKWKAAMELYEKAAHYVQGAMLENKFPSVTALNSAYENAEINFPGASEKELSGWIKKIRSRIEDFPSWDAVRRNAL
ncbi:hypothetical protein MPER_08980 [Moniliophthora perniciosa FA553]|nr:hypothetical protein MPER_08980 [Moniliophthora perniciosa FA553]